MDATDGVLAKQACAELLHRYAMGIAKEDAEAMVALYTSDAVWERANGEVRRGHSELRELFEGLFGQRRLLRHVNGAIVIDIVDADHATFWSQTVEYLYPGSNEVPAPLEGPRGVVEYDGTCVRRDGRWLLASGKATAMFRRVD
jgi:uncharacterized protein (TIGR02246 family)